MFNIKRTMYLPFNKQARRQHLSLLSENASIAPALEYMKVGMRYRLITSSIFLQPLIYGISRDVPYSQALI